MYKFMNYIQNLCFPKCHAKGCYKIVGFIVQRTWLNIVLICVFREKYDRRVGQSRQHTLIKYIIILDVKIERFIYV